MARLVLAFGLIAVAVALTMAAPAMMGDDDATTMAPSSSKDAKTPAKIATRALASPGTEEDEGGSDTEAADDNDAKADDEGKSIKARSYDQQSNYGSGSSSSYGSSSSSYGSQSYDKPEYPTNSYDEDYKDYDKDTYKVGGYGKSTVLKGVKVKVVPWVREGVQYIPKKFYIYGQVQTKTPYYKRVTTSVQHLGPGKTKYYKETTGVENGPVQDKPLPYVDKSSKYWTAATQYNTEYDNSYDYGGDSSYGGGSSSYGSS